MLYSTHRARCLIGLLAAGLLTTACGLSDRGPVIRYTTTLANTFDTEGPYTVQAMVFADNGLASVELWYRVNGGESSGTLMLPVEGDVFQGAIPGQPLGTRVEYWLAAADLEGLRSTDPRGAPASVHSFWVGEARPGDDPAADMGPDVDADPDAYLDVATDVDPPTCVIALESPAVGEVLGVDHDERPDLPGIQVTARGHVEGVPAGGAFISLNVNRGQQILSQELFNRRFTLLGVALHTGENRLHFSVDNPNGGKCDLSVALTAQGRPDDPTVPVLCEADGDCPAGSVCEDERCVEPVSCVDSRDCEVGFVCREETCVRVTDIPAGGCTVDADCAEGFVCTFNLCTPERCYEDRDCAAGQQCFSGECIPDLVPLPDRCQESADCGPGENCLANLCVPRQCESDADCGAGDNCLLGFCAPFDPPIPLDTCDTDADCDFPLNRCYLGVCVPPIPGLPAECLDDRDCPPGQACTVAICLDAECTRNDECPSGQECLFGFCSPEDLPLPIPGTCSVDSDCPEGADCLFTVCVPSNAPIPRPCDSDADCPSSLSCSFGFCLPFSFSF